MVDPGEFVQVYIQCKITIYFQFSTEAYIVLYAMTHRDMPEVTDIPSGFPVNGRKEEKLSWLKVLAMEIVNFCERPFPKADVQAARTIIKDPLLARTNEPGPTEEDPLSFCTCHQGIANIYIYI